MTVTNEIKEEILPNNISQKNQQRKTFRRGIRQDQVLVSLLNNFDGKLRQALVVLDRADVATAPVAVTHAPVDAASFVADRKDGR